MAIWLALAVATVPLAEPAPKTAACVVVQGDARYRNYGYDHVVIVRNGCDRKAICDVSTNVNPEPARVEVPAGSAAEVLTFRGSPAREFVPRATCRLSS